MPDKAGDNADHARDADRKKNVRNRDRHRDPGKDVISCVTPAASSKPDNAADDAQAVPTRSKTASRICLRVAPSAFRKPDLERPLGHGDEHDVHHDDAADDERDQRDRHDDAGDGAGKLVDLIAEILRVDEAESVFFAADQLAMVAKSEPRVLDACS